MNMGLQFGQDTQMPILFGSNTSQNYYTIYEQEYKYRNRKSFCRNLKKKREAILQIMRVVAEKNRLNIIRGFLVQIHRQDRRTYRNQCVRQTHRKGRKV